MGRFKLNEVDKVEILTLDDNYIDLTSGDNSAIVARALPVKDMQVTNSILAEGGFSALVKPTTNEKTRTMIFDFGFSRDIAARNAEALNADLTEVEAAALSHGHIDHFGGLAEVAARISKSGLELVIHPAAFRPNRYLEPIPGIRVGMPPPEREQIKKAGFRIVETEEPHSLLDGDVLFLGGIPRRTDFEKGMPNAFYEEDGEQKRDHIEDDTSLVMNIKAKGLVILSGCAHAGIINTVKHARDVTGIDMVHVVMGGFHLSGPAFEPIIDDTVKAMKEIAPAYVIPTHCTGRKAAIAFEKAMPAQFILNMSGTKLTFAA
ncbi:MAG: MBL fold metallo-hydrolase [Desulfobacteraceae bacterium]|nr:MBL fold metallo-hydrolase [Desulfobacteraceae bacterium]